MEAHAKKNEWMSVPQFGAWDQTMATATNYSVVFQHARANRKQNMVETFPTSFEREHEFKMLERYQYPENVSRTNGGQSTPREVHSSKNTRKKTTQESPVVPMISHAHHPSLLSHVHHVEKNVLIPQFGGWDNKSARTDYTMVFQRARANRKHNKVDIPHISFGSERELMMQQHDSVQSPIKRKKLFRYLSSCCGA